MNQGAADARIQTGPARQLQVPQKRGRARKKGPDN